MQQDIKSPTTPTKKSMLTSAVTVVRLLGTEKRSQLSLRAECGQVMIVCWAVCEARAQELLLTLSLGPTRLHVRQQVHINKSVSSPEMFRIPFFRLAQQGRERVAKPVVGQECLPLASRSFRAAATFASARISKRCVLPTAVAALSAERPFSPRHTGSAPAPRSCLATTQLCSSRASAKSPSTRSKSQLLEGREHKIDSGATPRESVAFGSALWSSRSSTKQASQRSLTATHKDDPTRFSASIGKRAACGSSCSAWNNSS